MPLCQPHVLTRSDNSMSALPDSRLPEQPAATSSQKTELTASLAVAAMCFLSQGILTGTACMEWRPACTAGLTAQGAGYRQLAAGISKRSSLHKGTAPLLFKGPAGTATPVSYTHLTLPTT